ncbi:methyltransferase [Leptolyngbya sp. AN02str]|uniref:methyltransferase n=1 Tax=Leptolyngbya sp. AN02str TaxID=3423363 RepID=UPI003D31BEA4
MCISTIAITESSYKDHVADRFGQATDTYSGYAIVQSAAAQTFSYLLQQYASDLPMGEILEIGCGTGFVTQTLVEQFPHHPLEITDLSLEMLECCQRSLTIPSTRSDALTFCQLDGESVTGEETYAAIVSGFVVQWFERPVESLHRLIHALQPGGVLLVSFPTDQSFGEWQTVCEALGLPYTANALPNAERLAQSLTSNQTCCQIYEQTFTAEYEGAIAFFNSLKQIGAGLQRSQQQLTTAQMRQLIRYWNRQTSSQISVQYHVAFLVIQKH